MYFLRQLFCKCVFWGSNFGKRIGEIIKNNCFLRGSSLQNVFFEGAIFENVVFEKAIFEKVLFEGANSENTFLEGALLK